MDVMRTQSILISGALLSLAAASARALAKPYVPPPQPTISTTSEVAEYAAAQTVLSRFIIALQTGRRARAASFLSSRVSQAEREGLIQKKWLKYNPKDRNSLTQVLDWRDLQIHTQRVFKDGAEMAVVSRTIALKPKPKGAPSGVFKVRMRKEGGDWRVELHPPKGARR
ncbi:MAG: hypothetical protein ACO1SX_02980 [Actinomycetota bacterium]